MSAEQSFARLLRTSRLASFDPRIPQVYTTHGRSRASGDWGLKRNLPTAVRTNYITVNALDTPQHQTPFESAQGQVWRLQRWHEAFPDSRPPKARSPHTPTNIMRLNKQQWRDFLQKAAQRKEEWRTSVRDLERQPDQHLAFMQAIYRPKSTIYEEARIEASAVYGALPTTAIVNDTGDHGTSLVGPSYDWWQTPQVPVKGRVLNRVTRGYAVGIGGIVALLPLSKALSISFLRPEITQYYVEKIRMNERGLVTVWLSQAPSTVGARAAVLYDADTSVRNAATHRSKGYRATMSRKEAIDTGFLDSLMGSYDVDGSSKPSSNTDTTTSTTDSPFDNWSNNRGPSMNRHSKYGHQSTRHTPSPSSSSSSPNDMSEPIDTLIDLFKKNKPNQ
ncbi:mitochondrial ribosomal protein subunit-domain-containing protein [Syncephalis fuscata]|nr:mitochondrial ribosomal protein subunit-domain-containing protein [Syncephalis fuscata]